MMHNIVASGETSLSQYVTVDSHIFSGCFITGSKNARHMLQVWTLQIIIMQFCISTMSTNKMIQCHHFFRQAEAEKTAFYLHSVYWHSWTLTLLNLRMLVVSRLSSCGKRVNPIWVYGHVQKKFPLFEFPSFLLLQVLGQQMHSQSVPTTFCFDSPLHLNNQILFHHFQK